MRERGIPKGWSAGTSRRDASHPKSQLPETPGSQLSADHLDSNTSQPSVELDTPPQPSVVPQESDEAKSPRPTLLRKIILPVTLSPKLQRWSKNWLFWAALGGLATSGMALISVALLLKLPSLPNCPAIFWPMASASVRLYCAQVAANKQTVNDLLEAIALVQALPADHPLRPEIDRYLQEWSLEVLNLADEAFQAGQLQEAIATARRIPQNVSAYRLVEERIDNWQSVWSQAENVYQAAEAEIRQQRWHQAYMAAVRLLNVGNNYWATTKYQELNDLIETTREDANRLTKAQGLAKAGGVDNLLAAIKLVEAIGPKSYIHQDAQEVLPQFGRQILDLAQKALDERDVGEAIAIANKVPASTSLQEEAEDFVALADAWRSAWTDTVQGLKDAIAQAQNITFNRPLYDQAQELVSRWQLEIEDVGHLERARELAQRATVKDLKAAITEAKLIPEVNPRYSEASAQINRWRSQIETIEDRPYLDRADQLAALGGVNSLQDAINEASQVASDRTLYQKAQSKIQNWTLQIQRIQDQPYLDRAEQLAAAGDIDSLQVAINEASQILSGRALYRQAQSRIRNWTSEMQQIQDQPYLDEARAFASSGNLPAAIATAQRIQPGRALSNQARAAINDWQGQIQARQNWQQARQVAVQGTPDALVQAIRLADRVPLTSPLRFDVNAAINQWGQQIMNIARSRGEYDIPGGIAIARLVPRASDAYRDAQQQIQIWQRFLNPPNPQASTTFPEVGTNN